MQDLLKFTINFYFELQIFIFTNIPECSPVKIFVKIILKLSFIFIWQGLSQNSSWDDYSVLLSQDFIKYLTYNTDPMFSIVELRAANTHEDATYCFFYCLQILLFWPHYATLIFHLIFEGT